MSGRPRIGLALGAGGARGWCHIGALRALAELGVTPDLVAGTSMGALVGAAWAANRLEALEEWVLALTPARFMRLMDVSLRSGGLVEATGIETLLADLGIPARIEDLPHPFTAIATDMETGREVWLTRGPTHPAVRASAGIPGVMSPKLLDGKWLLDGGLTNPVPVSATRALGADVIIAINPNGRPGGRFWQPPEPRGSATARMAALLPEALTEALGLDPQAEKPTAPNYFDVLTAAIEVMEAQIRRARLAGEPPHVLLNAAFSDLMVLELYRGAEAIAEGRRMVERQRHSILEMLENI
ncbi:MAG TPA: patatin [Aliiroseovarius sp.]|nr:patatin [Aliiroseovarius sp.]